MTSLSYRVRELWIDARAVAAVEFAIVVPFMLLLYVGGVEISNGMAINVKVTATTHSVADMVSQNTQVSAAQLQTILGASTAIIAPYPTTSGGTSLMTVTVSQVSTDAIGNATVQWSQSYNGTTFGAGRPVGQAITLPSSLTGIQNYNVSFILGEGSYAYTPNLGYTISGTVMLGDSYYLFPRCSTNSPLNSSFPYYSVQLTSTTTCTCIQHLQQKSC